MRTRFVALMVLASLAVAACGASTADTESASAAGEGDVGLDGQFTTLQGDTIDLADFEGQDVVLWFWAPW